MNEVEEEQTRERERQSARLRGEPTAGGRNQIIGQRIRQKSLGADVRDDLQPRADEGQATSSRRFVQSPRDVRIFPSRLLTERGREKSGVRDRGRQDHRK